MIFKEYIDLYIYNSSEKIRMDFLLLKVSTTERNGFWGRVKRIFIFVIYIFLLLECFMGLHYFRGIKNFP